MCRSDRAHKWIIFVQNRHTVGSGNYTEKTNISDARQKEIDFLRSTLGQEETLEYLKGEGVQFEGGGGPETETTLEKIAK